jgi:hypothetical protein
MSYKNRGENKESGKKENIVFDKGTIVTMIVPLIIIFAAMFLVFYIAGVFE